MTELRIMTDTDRPLDLAEIRETFRHPTRVLDSLVRALVDEAARLTDENERLAARAEAAEAKVHTLKLLRAKMRPSVIFNEREVRREYEAIRDVLAKVSS